MYIFFLITILGMLLFCYWKPYSVGQFYFRCTILGLGLGYWTLLVTTAAEQFVTGIRATAASSIPNIARAWSIPFNILFKDYLKPLIVRRT